MLDENFYKVYKEIAAEVRRELEIDYIYNTNRLEGSRLPKYATRKLLMASKGVANCKQRKRFRYQDMVAVQNHPRAIKYVRKIASLPNYQITEADIKRIHFAVVEHLVSNPGEYRQHDVRISGSKFIAPSFRNIAEEMRTSQFHE